LYLVRWQFTVWMQAKLSVGVKASRVSILIVAFALLWIGLPIAFVTAGAGHWLKQSGLGMDAFRYLLLGSGLTILALMTMGLRRVGPLATARELGLAPFSVRTSSVSVFAAAVMAGILYVLGQAPQIPDLGSLVAAGIAGTFAEEVGFRGFLFLQFRRWVALPFWVAAIASSALFGLAHYGQGHTVATSLAAASVTFLGGVLFCWLTERSGNLWAAIFLHAGFNVVWTVFKLGDNAVGNLSANLARLTAVATLIVITVAWTQRASLPGQSST
jgi:membrane protease YdiL (CAAX protease family)